MECQIECRVARNIDRFHEQIWDGLVGEHFFSSHRFIRCLERSRIPGVEMWHLLFFENAKPVACTSLFSHPFELDLIAPRWVRKVSQKLKGIPGHFLNTRILFCGLPISLGKSHLWMDKGLGEERVREIWKMLDLCMKNIARQHDIHLIGAKEFDRRGPAPQMGQMAQSFGYIRCHSLHTTTLPVTWDSFEEYICSLRAKYRRQAIKDMERSKKGHIYWCKRKAETIDPQILYTLYQNVFERSENRLEKLSVFFFREFSHEFGDRAEVVLGVRGERIIAQALLFHGREKTTFMFAGLDYRYVKPFGIYQNLLLQVVRAAIRRRKTILEMGQTSYDVKQRLGATVRPLVFYLKDRVLPYHWTLKHLAPILYPEVCHARRNVFRKDSGISSAQQLGYAQVSKACQQDLPRGFQLDPAA